MRRGLLPVLVLATSSTFTCLLFAASASGFGLRLWLKETCETLRISSFRFTSLGLDFSGRRWMLSLVSSNPQHRKP